MLAKIACAKLRNSSSESKPLSSVSNRPNAKLILFWVSMTRESHTPASITAHACTLIPPDVLLDWPSTDIRLAPCLSKSFVSDMAPFWPTPKTCCSCSKLRTGGSFIASHLL